MVKNERLAQRLAWSNTEAADEARQIIEDAINGEARDILRRLYFLGPHHLYNTSISAYSLLENFGLVLSEGRIAFLTTAGTRFCILSRYQDLKDAWQRDKNLIRERQIKEMNVILGVRSREDEGDENDELPSNRG